MSRAIRGYGGWSRHRFPCANGDCPFCEPQAEARAEDIEPDYDVEGAENGYERAMEASWL